MPKKRKSENRKLPERWQHHHGAYYYRVPHGQEDQWDGKKKFRLGKTLAEAYREWASRVDRSTGIHTIGQLLDKYLAEVTPNKAPRTQIDDQRYAQILRGTFEKMPIGAIKPKHAYQYATERGYLTAARHEIGVLRHALTKAVEWGAIDKNPLLGQLRLPRSSGRDRYIEDWEIVECLSLTATRKKGSVRMIQAYIKIKLLIGCRRTDMLKLRVSDLQDDGVHVTPQKTAKTTRKSAIYEWHDDLRAAVDEALAARPVDIGPYVFCDRKGQPYVKEDGQAWNWESIWSRFMARVLKETKVEKRFAERDLRAKCATDAESLDHARQLLQHASDSTTRKWYRRKPEIIKPR